MQNVVKCFCCFALVVFILGCGANPHPELRRVSGRVIYKGRPIADATVAFYSNESKRLATGYTDKSGSYSLTSYAEDDGALPGQHRVVVTKVEVAENSESLSMDDALKTRQREEPSRHLLPKIYASSDTTPLIVTVNEDGQNEIQLDLID